MINLNEFTSSVPGPICKDHNIQIIAPWLAKVLRYYDRKTLNILVHKGSCRTQFKLLPDDDLATVYLIAELLAYDVDRVSLKVMEGDMILSFYNTWFPDSKYFRLAVEDLTGVPEPEIVDPIKGCDDEVFWLEGTDIGNDLSESIGRGDSDIYRQITEPLSRVVLEGTLYKVVKSVGVGFVHTWLRPCGDNER